MLLFVSMRDLRRACVRSLVLLVLAACGGDGGSGNGDLVSIEVEPANATVMFTGTAVSLDYQAIGHYADGSTAKIDNAVFSLDADASRLGTFGGATFTTEGQGAGKGSVIAQVGEVSGATGVIVVVHRTDLGPGVPADGATKFPDTVAPPGAQSPSIVYPLQDAIVPTSMKAPVVQWEGAGAADHLYRVRVVSGLATVDTILAYEPNFKFALQPPADRWQRTDSFRSPSSTGTRRRVRKEPRRSPCRWFRRTSPARSTTGTSAPDRWS